MPSGRWQVRYRRDDGVLRPAPATFARRMDAERFLAQMDLDRVRGGWVDPEAGAIPMATYVEQWLVERTEPLRPRTVDLYRSLLRLHILPTFGPVHLNSITSGTVRTWHASLRQRGVGDPTVAKAYRLHAWEALQSIEDRGDRLVTAERLAQIELSAKFHAKGSVRRLSSAGTIPAQRFPAPGSSDPARRLVETRKT